MRNIDVLKVHTKTLVRGDVIAVQSSNKGELQEDTRARQAIFGAEGMDMAEEGFYTVRGYELLHSHSRMLTTAMEDYLEMIRRTAGDGVMRVSELADLLNVKASSATKMLQRLGELRLIDYRRYGIVQLTPAGVKMGEYLLRRHDVVEKFLSAIGITENLLAETELMEHSISAGTLARLETLCRFLEANPDVRERFTAFVEYEEREQP